MCKQDIRTHEQPRATMEEIERMPALLDTIEGACIVGTTPLNIARGCANGTYPAVKVGRAWRINKAKLLEAVGLA